MKIIVHSSYSAQTIGANLGKAQYSYYFVLAGYLPVLRQLGDVVTVDDPETEADAIFDACQAKGEACVFLCFAPPHLVPITLRCPTIPILAWEFSTIPCEMWSDDPRSDWRVVFAHCKRVIVLSHHTAALVREAMGEDFPVFVIPTATYEGFAGTGPAQPVADDYTLHLRGYLFDSAADERFMHNSSWPPVPPPHFVPPAPEVLAPLEPVRPGLRRRVGLTLYYAHAWYRDVLRDIVPGPLKRLASVCGRRLYRLYKARKQAPPGAAPPLPEQDVVLSGVVYTSVFSPLDGRKNWHDLVSGFIWAFRDRPDATLFLKGLVKGGVEAFPALYALLSQFAPFRCRVVFFAGFLSDDEYRELIRGTSYYVNCSHAEGLCMPLMEFLSAGRPAIAPDYTAMADYIDPRIAFVLSGSLEHNVWPFDPRDLFTTMRYRLNWETLVAAYEQSYALAMARDERYDAMSAAAHVAMQAFCAEDVVRGGLAEALGIAVPAPALRKISPENSKVAA